MAKRDLRSMKKGTGDSRIKREDIKEAAKKVNMNADVDQIDNGDIKSVEDTISQYENKSEDELMNDLESMVRKGKQDGTFSDDNARRVYQKRGAYDG